MILNTTEIFFWRFSSWPSHSRQPSNPLRSNSRKNSLRRVRPSGGRELMKRGQRWCEEKTYQNCEHRNILWRGTGPLWRGRTMWRRCWGRAESRKSAVCPWWIIMFAAWWWCDQSYLDPDSWLNDWCLQTEFDSFSGISVSLLHYIERDLILDFACYYFGSELRTSFTKWSRHIRRIFIE